MLSLHTYVPINSVGWIPLFVRLCTYNSILFFILSLCVFVIIHSRHHTENAQEAKLLWLNLIFRNINWEISKAIGMLNANKSINKTERKIKSEQINQKFRTYLLSYCSPLLHICFRSSFVLKTKITCMWRRKFRTKYIWFGETSMVSNSKAQFNDDVQLYRHTDTLCFAFQTFVWSYI